MVPIVLHTTGIDAAVVPIDIGSGSLEFKRIMKTDMEKWRNGEMVPIVLHTTGIDAAANAAVLSLKE
ncbi:MAG: hypothetical protein C0408_09570 [Odoribacter sp.]|nr:hypothetical protein [Odoribacter sp.]